MSGVGPGTAVPPPAPLPPGGLRGPLGTWAPLLLVVGYVAPFYFRPYAPRNAPSTVYFRITAILLWCSVAWLPLYFHLSYHQVNHCELSRWVGLFVEQPQPR